MNNFATFGKQIMENGVFVLEFIGIVVGMVLLSYFIEKLAKKKTGDKERILNNRTIAVVGIFSAISGVLMAWEIPLLLIAPEIYVLDFSELPALIAGFAFGPVAGVLVEFIKLPIKLLIKPSGTAFVGELANFLIGCVLIIPASSIYRFYRKKKGAILGCVVGTLLMAAFGAFLNAVYLLPVFAKMFMGGPEGLDVIISWGTAVNSAITNIQTFVIIAVAPMNLIKGGCASLLSILLYQPLRPLMKTTGNKKKSQDSKAKVTKQEES